MFDPTLFLLFIPASILLILAPGPDIIFTITQGVTNGRRAGVATALGLCLGNSVHTIAAAFGLSIIFKTSALAFNGLKIFGVLYLVYLGIMAIKNRHQLINLDKDIAPNTKKLFIRGFFMNILNPKVAIFFLAFLPQFVNSANGHIPLQIIILGLTFMSLVAIIFGTIGYSAGYLKNWLVKKTHLNKYISYLTASIFFGLGIKLALTKR